jgi:hypothetical protein
VWIAHSTTYKYLQIYYRLRAARCLGKILWVALALFLVVAVAAVVLMALGRRVIKCHRKFHRHRNVLNHSYDRMYLSARFDGGRHFNESTADG